MVSELIVFDTIGPCILLVVKYFRVHGNRVVMVIELQLEFSHSGKYLVAIPTEEISGEVKGSLFKKNFKLYSGPMSEGQSCVQNLVKCYVCLQEINACYNDHVKGVPVSFTTSNHV